MKIEELPLLGLILIWPKIHNDNRGYFFERFRTNQFETYGLPTSFVQENQAKSEKGIIRGLHYQLKHPQGKLVWVPYGEVYDVVVDIRRGSPTFGKHYGTILSDEDHKMLFIPKGFAHGYSVLSTLAIFQYKCTNYYQKEDEYGLRWDDPDLAINWKTTDPVVSTKDVTLPFLKDTPEQNLPIYES